MVTENGETLTIWVIYNNPSDHPGKYVLRPQWIYPGRVVVADEPTAVVDSLAEAREHVPYGLYLIGRNAEDDPTIVETWF